MQTDAQLIQLETERTKGAQASTSWNTFVQPFFNKKEQVLIEAFRQCPIRDDQGLMNIKLQFTAIDALKSEMMEYIETGKMADISLQQATRKDAKEEKDD